MKVYAMTGVNEANWVEKPRPECGPDDVILRPLTLAPCSSDTHTLSGVLGVKQDLALGHEGTGIVDEIGSNIKHLKVGDKVIIPAVTPDWFTNEAQDGLQQHSGGMFGGIPFTTTLDGIFCEFIKIQQGDANLTKLPEGLDIEAATMISDMTPTGFHGVELANVRFGDSVVVIGIGPVGLMAVQGSVIRGAARLFAVGSRPNCVEIAKQFGATDIIDYHNGDIVDQIIEKNAGQVDRVILAGGDQETFTQAVKLLKPGGTLANINYFDSLDALEIPILNWGMGMSNIDIRGGLMPGGGERMRRLANLALAGRIHPEALITHRFEGFDKLPEAVQLMADKPKDLIKPIVICE
jgi:threonine dehydrogenase-like Zn-dependent dehydrogenase